MSPVREAALFHRLGYIDIQHLADRIRGRVLFVAGLSDKEILPYHEYGHEYLPYLSDRAISEFLRLWGLNFIKGFFIVIAITFVNA